MVEEIKLYKNKELREFLASKELTDKTIESLNIELYFKKWCSYEDEVIYTDLEYKGYKYEMEGVLEEKWSEVELYSDFDDYEPFRTLDKFFERIKEYELHEMEDHFNFEYIGEPDTWSFVKINWLDDVPEIIKKEFHNTYIETCKYNDLKGENIRYDGSAGNFYQKNNNIDRIVLNIKIESEEYRIQWVNTSPEYPISLIGKNPKDFTNEDWENEFYYLENLRAHSMTPEELDAEKLNDSACEKLEKGQLDLALIDIRKSITLSSNEFNNDTAAEIYLKLENLDEALKHANISIKMDDTIETHLITRAKIFIALNKKDFAVSDLKRVQELGGNIPNQEASILLKALIEN